jgi:hypothetical protein
MRAHSALAATAVDVLRRERVIVRPTAAAVSIDDACRAVAQGPGVDGWVAVPVWVGESTGTVWGPARANWAGRAWHDLRHAELGTPGDLPGELATLDRQLADVRGRHARELLTLDVAAFARFHAAHGRFPRAQSAFVLAAAWGLDRALRGPW